MERKGTIWAKLGTKTRWSQVSGNYITKFWSRGQDSLSTRLNDIDPKLISRVPDKNGNH